MIRVAQAHLLLLSDSIRPDKRRCVNASGVESVLSGAKSLEREVANPPTEIETAWASAQGSNGRYATKWITSGWPPASRNRRVFPTSRQTSSEVCQT